MLLLRSVRRDVTNTGEPDLSEIGPRLREARELRNLTRRDIWQATKIPISTLEAIDRNDVARLPQSFFTRAFVRAYAAEVGLNPAFTEEYFAQFRVPAEPAAEPPEPQPQEVVVDERTNPLSLLAVLTLCMALAAYSASLQTAAQASVPSAPFDIVPTTGDLHRAEVPVPVSLVGEPVEGSMRLQIRSQGACVISATADGQPGTSRVVQRGETFLVEGREEIVLRVTDPGACVDVVAGAGLRSLSAAAVPVATATLPELALHRPSPSDVVPEAAYDTRVEPVESPATVTPSSPPAPASLPQGTPPDQPSE